MRAISPRRRVRWYAYTAVTTAVVLVFALAEWWTERLVSDRSRIASTVIEVAIVLLAALAFQPFHRRVEGAVESAFTRRRRQAIEALARFRSELTSFNDTAQLLRRVVEAIERHMEAAACAVYVRRERYRAEVSTFDTPASDVDIDDPLAVRMRSTGTPAYPPSLRSCAVGTVAFPMTIAGDLIGFLCVHAKYGDFESDEMQTLALLADSLAIALTALDPLLRVQNLHVPNNLPADLPPLIGRGDEIAEIKTLLHQSRLVTLTGAGGVGKTRLAQHVASEMRANPEGIWFVDLAPLDDPALVPSAIAAIFDVADEGGDRHLIERVGAALRSRQLLIVLDNCEHLIGAAAAAVKQLLQIAPRVQILATSREPLGLTGEEVYRVPSLSIPPRATRATAEAVMGSAAGALFVARARSADRTFELTEENAQVVADIVRRLDGIAMAIELAAPRLKVLSVEQLRARLDERFTLLTGGDRTALPRHQTLHALIAWSYDLLDESEQRLLRNVAVLRGEWKLEAAEALGEDDHGRAPRVLDLIESLVDKSLTSVQVQGNERRYRLSESMRQFALERLVDSAEEANTYRRYCRYYACLSAISDEAYWRSDSDAWTAEIRNDLENYRGAIAFGLNQGGDAVCAAAIVGHLRWYWYTTARREGSTLIARASALAGDAPANVCGLLALCSALLDTTAHALPSALQAITMLHDANERAETEALALAGIALGRAARMSESRARFDQAASAARRIGEPRLTGWVLSMVAYWAGVAGDLERALQLFEEAAQMLRLCADPWQLARLHVHRAEFLFTQGEIEHALASVREAESLFRARFADTGLCVALLNATAYLLALGRFHEARETVQEGLALAQRLDNAMASAWAFGHVAELAAEGGDMRAAARLLGRADAVYFETGGAREPTEQRGYDRALELIRTQLSEKEMFDLMEVGARTPLDAIASEAMTVFSPRAPNVVH